MANPERQVVEELGDGDRYVHGTHLLYRLPVVFIASAGTPDDGLSASGRGGRNRLDFDLIAVVEVPRRHHRAGGAMVAHHAGVDGVDPAPQADVRDVDRHLHDTVEPTADGLQIQSMRGFQVIEMRH